MTAEDVVVRRRTTTAIFPDGKNGGKFGLISIKHPERENDGRAICDAADCRCGPPQAAAPWVDPVGSGGAVGHGPRFISELDNAKPTVAMNTVLAVLATLGLRLEVRQMPPQ